MSLGCIPQTGKVLKYNSWVNNQLAHKTVQLTLVKLGNKVRQQRATFLHPTNQTVSRFYDRLTVTISRTFYAAVSHKSSRVTLTLSHFSTQSHNSTDLLTSLVTRTWQLSHMQFSRRPGCRPQHAEREDKGANCESRRSMSQKMAGQRSLYAKTVDRKLARDWLLHIVYGACV